MSGVLTQNPEATPVSRAVSHKLNTAGWKTSIRRNQVNGITVVDRDGHVTITVRLGDREKNRHTAEDIARVVNTWTLVDGFPAVDCYDNGVYTVCFICGG